MSETIPSQDSAPDPKGLEEEKSQPVTPLKGVEAFKEVANSLARQQNLTSSSSGFSPKKRTEIKRQSSDLKSWELPEKEPSKAPPVSSPSLQVKQATTPQRISPARISPENYQSLLEKMAGEQGGTMHTPPLTTTQKAPPKESPKPQETVPRQESVRPQEAVQSSSLLSSGVSSPPIQPSSAVRADGIEWPAPAGKKTPISRKRAMKKAADLLSIFSSQPSPSLPSSGHKASPKKVEAKASPAPSAPLPGVQASYEARWDGGEEQDALESEMIPAGNTFIQRSASSALEGEGVCEVSIESLGGGIVSALGSVVGGVVGAGKSLGRKGQSRQTRNGHSDTTSDGSSPVRERASGQGLNEQMGGRVTGGVWSIFSGVGQIAVGGTNIVVGTLGCFGGALVCVSSTLVGTTLSSEKRKLIKSRNGAK
ncbi:MAG: hypothetical protein HQL72_15465 [Magnetococcales bacterium]|nr:hypothetical protein [Magnetococcales bacterium]